MKKRSILFILVATMMILCCSMFTSNAETIAEGECGASDSTITWRLDDAGTLVLTGSGRMKSYSESDYSSEQNPFKRLDVKSVIICDGITEISSSAFYNCRSIESVDIPDSVTSIEPYAFQRCFSLESIDVPSSVTKIGQCAFRYCSNLSEITIRSNETTIGGEAFCLCAVKSAGPIGSGCDFQFAWTDKIPGNTFTSCPELRNVEFPDGLKSIGGRAFYSCSHLKCIEIPDGVTTIGDEAFNNCTSLKKIIVPASVTKIGDFSSFRGTAVTSAGPIGSGKDYEFGWTKEIPNNAFSGCKYLASVSLPNGITGLGESAFSSCESLKTIALPSPSNSSYFNIGKGCFSCSGLEEITTPNNCYIRDGAFLGCNSLSSVIFSDRTYLYGSYIFSRCTSLKSIILPPNEDCIADEMFDNCTSLKIITFPGKIEEIGASAFRRCDSLTDVYYSGNKTEWESIKIGNNNDALMNATIHYESPTAPPSGGDGPSGDDPNNNELDFSKDVWNFENFSDNRCFDNESTIPYIYDLSPASRSIVKQYMNKGRKGHCFGMSATVILQKLGMEDLTRWDTNASSLRQLIGYGYERTYICYYHAMEFLLDFEAECQSYSRKTVANQLKDLAEKADSVKNGANPVMLCFGKTGWGDHAVVAYALESGTFESSSTGRKYDHRVLIYDSNAVDWNGDYCLLFNEGTSNWEIPHYANKGVASFKGGYLLCAAADTKAFDKKEDVHEIENVDYIRPILHIDYSDNVVIKRIGTNEQWTVDAVTGEVDGSTELFYHYDLSDDGQSNKGINIALPYNNGSYTVEPAGNSRGVDVSVLSTEKHLCVSADSASRAEIDLDGDVSLLGNKGAFQITAADNNMEGEGKYDTFSISGSSEGNTSLSLNDGGVTIEGDDISGSLLEASNGSGSSTVTVDATSTAEYTNSVSDFVDDHSHKWGTSYIVDTPATCTSTGSESIHCSLCGAIKEGSSRGIPATGHSWTQYVSQNATEFSTGVMTHRCTKCGSSFNTAIPAITLPTDLPGVKMSKPKGAKGKITVKWKKPKKKALSSIQGIEIRVVGPGVDKVTTAGKKKTSKKISGLMKKQSYTVQVRTYAYIGGVKHVSAWSTKTAKTK